MKRQKAPARGGEGGLKHSSSGLTARGNGRAHVVGQDGGLDNV